MLERDWDYKVKWMREVRATSAEWDGDQLVAVTLGPAAPEPVPDIEPDAEPEAEESPFPRIAGNSRLVRKVKPNAL